MNTALENEEFLALSVKELECINKKMARLLVRKEELTDGIISALHHEHEGQKAYDYDMWRIEVKTPFVYSIDKKKYESGAINIPDEYNPVRKSVSYSVDKRACESYMSMAPKKVRDALCEIIEKKPGKANVVIKERTQ
jgi:hypothetical protein